MKTFRIPHYWYVASALEHLPEAGLGLNTVINRTLPAGGAPGTRRLR